MGVRNAQKLEHDSRRHPGPVDLWITIWEAPHDLAERGILVEVEHVKAHRTKKEKTYLSHFEKFVTEGNEKADEL